MSKPDGGTDTDSKYSTEGGKEPPLFVGLGNTEPPRSALKANLAAFLYGEASDRDPLLFSGHRQLLTHVGKECPGAVRPPSKGLGKKPRTGRQSTRNWSFTVSQELSRKTTASVYRGTGTVALEGAAPWSGTPLVGASLKAEADAAIARAKSSEGEAKSLEIVSQASSIEVLFSLLVGANPDDHPSTVELIDIAAAAVAAPLYEIKRLLDVTRPSELANAPDAPRIPVPGHGSFPSGHATASYALAALLSAVTNADENRKCRLSKAAERLADNRMVAGLHTASDTAAGKSLGEQLGAWLASPSLRSASPQWGELYAQASQEW